MTRGKNSGPAGSADEPPFDSVQSPINELFEAATGEHPREKDEAFARILEALPGPLAAGQERALRREIEDVAFCYRAFGGRETMPSSIVAGRLEAVAKAADRICNSLGYQCRPDPEQAADPSGAVSHHIPTELRMSLMGRARAMAEEVGGLDYVMSLSDNVPSTQNLEYFASIVEQRAIARRLIEGVQQIESQARGGGAELDELLDFAEKTVFDVTQQGTKQDWEQLSTVVDSTFMEIQARSEQGPGEVTGVPTGFVDLDKILAGLHKTDLMVLAARPAMGKTALALNIHIVEDLFSHLSLAQPAAHLD